MNHEELMQQLASDVTDKLFGVRKRDNPAEVALREATTVIIRSYGDEIYKMGYRQGVKDCSEKEPPPMSQDVTVGGGTVEVVLA